MQGASVIRDDGTRGKVVPGDQPGELAVEFTDGSRLTLIQDRLTPLADGTYRLSPELSGREHEELVIPVVAEELTVDTVKVARSRVRVNKRVETREEVVDRPVVHEEVFVEHVPVNRIVDEPPGTREEDGVLIIPLIEEILVIEKRLLVREEIRVSRRRTTTSTKQTITLRREVADIEREELNDVDNSQPGLGE